MVGNQSPKPKDNQKGQQSKKLPVGPRPCTRSLTKELELVGGEEEGAVLPLLDVDEERLRQQRESTTTGNVVLHRQRRGPQGGLAGRPPRRPRTRARRPENYVENMESIVRKTVSQVLASINSSNVGTSHERVREIMVGMSLARIKLQTFSKNGVYALMDLRRACQLKNFCTA